MAYKQKLSILLAIIAALALIYALALVFDPERSGSRSAAYTWLDPKLNDKIDRISISNASGETAELTRKNNEWFVAHNGTEYPAKRLRVEDFLGLLNKRSPYPLRTSSASAHERLGLAENAASRIIVSGGAGLAEQARGQPLLDLLVGMTDNTGREVYLRKAGENDARSGENKFGAYISGPAASWYNLRLLDGGEALDVSGVQRLSVYAAGQNEPAVFSRWNREWTVSGITVARADTGKIEAYIRAILDTEGDNFDDSVNAADPRFEDSRIVLELGSGGVKTIRLAPAAEDGRRLAVVAGSPYVYSIAPWAAERLFKNAADFEKDN
jgi:hypothetical protein